MSHREPAGSSTVNTAGEAYARSADRRCRRPAVGSHGKCDKHGGASTGPRDPALLEGNDHAAGNTGGGPPPLNTNAQTHGAWNDPLKEYRRLDGDAKRLVDPLADEAIDRSKADIPPDHRT